MLWVLFRSTLPATYDGYIYIYGKRRNIPELLSKVPPLITNPMAFKCDKLVTTCNFMTTLHILGLDVMEDDVFDSICMSLFVFMFYRYYLQYLGRHA